MYRSRYGIIVKVANQHQDLQRLEKIKASVEGGRPQSFTLYFTKGTSNKYWRLEDTLGEAYVTYGRIGSKGTTKVVPREVGYKRALEKIKKGYTFTEPAGELKSSVLNPKEIQILEGDLVEYRDSLSEVSIERVDHIAQTFAKYLNKIGRDKDLNLTGYYDAFTRPLLVEAQLLEETVSENIRNANNTLRGYGVIVATPRLAKDIARIIQNWRSQVGSGISSKYAFFGSKKQQRIKLVDKMLKEIRSSIDSDWNNFVGEYDLFWESRDLLKRVQGSAVKVEEISNFLSAVNNNSFYYNVGAKFKDKYLSEISNLKNQLYRLL